MVAFPPAQTSTLPADPSDEFPLIVVLIILTSPPATDRPPE